MLKNGLTAKLKPFTWMGAIAAVATTATTIGFSMMGAQSQGNIIKVDGSSTVFPITEAVAEDFQKRTGTRVTVGISGTGGGFKKFCNGETDISNASRPILKKEMDACKAKGISYFELPVAYDALTVVVNPQNKAVSNITVAELKKMWEPAAQGKIKNWNQVNSKWPNAPLRLFGPGPDSGTFDYFTEAIVGKSKSSRTDYTPSEDDNVLVQGVSRDKNALGYFGFAYYVANRNRLKAVTINGVAPSEQTVLNGKYQPLSRPIFIYVSTKAAQRPEVKRFVQFYMANGARLAKQVKYVPLPAKAYQVALGHFNQGKAGTRYGGDEAVGLTIEELLQREAR
jgi:phosphate transport system substrate-binding protein